MEPTRRASVRDGLTRAVERRPEAAALVAIPALLLAQWALALAFHLVAGPSAWVLYAGVVLLVWAGLCVLGSGQAVAASILGPVAAGAATAFAMAAAGLALAPLPLIGAFAWLVVWLVAWDRVWPAWEHRVLRRPRPDPFEAAYGRVLHHFYSLAPGSDASALWSEVQALDEWRTFRTAPLIDLLAAWLDLGVRNGDADRAERMRARLVGETAAYRASDAAAPDADAHPERPTRGTPLEFLFPELEALLAAAQPAQQRRMAVEAARYACRSEGVLDDALARALDAAAAGKVDPSARASLDPGLIAPPADADPAAYGRFVARLSAWRAMADDLGPNDAGDAIYDAARQRDDVGLSEMARILGSILDDDARAAARAVEPDPEVLARIRAAARTQRARPQEWSTARLAPAGIPIAGLVAIGLVAGVLGTALREPLWPLVRVLPGRTSLDVTLGIILVAVAAWALLRITGARTGGSVVVGLFLASGVASLLIDPLVAAGDALLSRLAPGFWSAVYADPSTVLPYAPYHGFAFAMMLIALAVVARLDDRRTYRRAEPGKAA